MTDAVERTVAYVKYIGRTLEIKAVAWWTMDKRENTAKRKNTSEPTRRAKKNI